MPLPVWRFGHPFCHVWKCSVINNPHTRRKGSFLFKKWLDELLSMVFCPFCPMTLKRFWSVLSKWFRLYFFLKLLLNFYIFLIFHVTVAYIYKGQNVPKYSQSILGNLDFLEYEVGFYSSIFAILCVFTPCTEELWHRKFLIMLPFRAWLRNYLKY